MKIKIKKQEHYLLESELFNAIVSEDVYQQKKGKPYMMTIEHTESQETLSVKFFSSLKKAIKYFGKHQKHWTLTQLHYELDKGRLESTFH